MWTIYVQIYGSTDWVTLATVTTWLAAVEMMQWLDPAKVSGYRAELETTPSPAVVRVQVPMAAPKK